MMFFVKGDLAAAVGLVDRARGGDAGAAAQVDDLGGRREKNLPACGADRGAEVDVLGVEKKSFVEEANVFGRLPSHQQAGAGDPVDVPLLARRAFDPA